MRMQCAKNRSLQSRLLQLTIISLLFLFNQALSQSLQLLTVILDWFPNPDHAPLFVAKEFGFFKKAGLAVTLIGPADPSDPPKLVAVGKADIAVTYQPQLIMQVNQGLPLIRIGTLIPIPLSCLVTKANSGINSIKDLQGKSIGYSSAGMDNTIVKVMLLHNGLSLNDVKLINVHYSLTQALLAGKIDAADGMMRNFELIQMHLNKVPGKAFFPEDNGVPPYEELILVTNKKELNDPRIVRFLNAVTAATAYLQQHPEQCWETFAKYHPELNNQLNKEAWFATLPHFALHPAALDQSRWINFIKFLQQQGVISKSLPLGNYAKELVNQESKN